MEFKILLVDDDEKVTSLLKRKFLEEEYYRVVIANSGERAKQIIDTVQVDLILLDIEMPNVSGLEILEYVKKKYPDVKVLVVTGYSEYEKAAERLGCDGFITKPFSFNKLTMAMKELLKEKNYEEVKKIIHTPSMFWRPVRGEPAADIMLLEPIEEIATPIGAFLQDSKRANGCYKVHVVETLRQAEILQELFYIDIVIADLRTFKPIADTLEKLRKIEHPPRDLIFYYEQQPSRDKARLDAFGAKRWDAGLLKEENFTKLAEVVNRAAIEHGLVRK